MPVDWTRYPPNWRQISERIRFQRAAGHCEGSPGGLPRAEMQRRMRAALEVAS